MEAIVLRAQDYREKERILTLFTKEQGVASLLVKGIGRRNTTATSPPAHTEFVVKSGRSDLLLCVEASLIKSHVGVRHTLAHLKATTTILTALLKTQLPGKPSETLFDLLCAYLTYLPNTKHPKTVGLSFLLKLEKHEGTLAIDSSLFSAEECQQIAALTHARSFALIEAIGEASAIAEKLSQSNLSAWEKH